MKLVDNYFQNIVDKLAGEIQQLSAKRKLGEKDLVKLKTSIQVLILDSVNLSVTKKKQHWASIHKSANRYSSSRYNNSSITYEFTLSVHMKECCS